MESAPDSDGVIARAWVDAVSTLGGAADAARSTAHELQRRYAQPHRSYHTTTHIQAVLRDAADLARDCDLDAPARAAVVLAACAHDVVYDAVPGQDEQASADWAATALLAAAVAHGWVARVRELILLTAVHSCDPDDLGAAILLDADLAILAAPPSRYRVYISAVRAEYRAVPESRWRTGRSELLRQLLDRDQLFATPAGRQRWERAARANIARELASLQV